MKTRFRGPVVVLALVGLLASCAPERPRFLPGLQRPLWFGLHVLVENTRDARELIAEIPSLARQGLNLIIAEVDYNFEYVSHPELRGSDPISKGTVKEFLRLCRAHKIRLIPEFQCLGHQSWEAKTFPLLVQYPEFDETPGLFPGNKGIYCRSWCPLHPDVHPIIFDLFDELIDAFEADALHVGMDEVFLIGHDACPRCKGKDPAELFAGAVKDYYGHLVQKRGLEMLMWGDRLIDDAVTGYGEWEASRNRTWRAVDLIPRDIVICDWHYERTYYPSLPLLLGKGFRVLPTSFKDRRAAQDLLTYSLTFPSERMLGHLCSIWRGAQAGKTWRWPALRAAAKILAGPKPLR